MDPLVGAFSRHKNTLAARATNQSLNSTPRVASVCVTSETTRALHHGWQMLQWRVMTDGLTIGASLENVVFHHVPLRPDAKTHAVLDVLEGVVVDVGVHGLHDGHPGVLHVVDVIVWYDGGRKAGMARGNVQRERTFRSYPVTVRGYPLHRARQMYVSHKMSAPFHYMMSCSDGGKPSLPCRSPPTRGGGGQG